MYNYAHGEYSECNDMQKFVRVDFDPDIDSLEEFKVKARKTVPVNVKEVDKPMYIGKNAKLIYYVYYGYGYDNSLEPDVEYINPVSRVNSIKHLSEAEKKELVINLKKVGRRAITETGFIVIAKRLFLAVNSLIKNDSRFTTVQQAYHYAIFNKKLILPKLGLTSLWILLNFTYIIIANDAAKPWTRTRLYHRASLRQSLAYAVTIICLVSQPF